MKRWIIGSSLLVVLWYGVALPLLPSIICDSVPVMQVLVGASLQAHGSEVCNQHAQFGDRHASRSLQQIDELRGHGNRYFVTSLPSKGPLPAAVLAYPEHHYIYRNSLVYRLTFLELGCVQVPHVSVDAEWRVLLQRNHRDCFAATADQRDCARPRKNRRLVVRRPIVAHLAMRVTHAGSCICVEPTRLSQELFFNQLTSPAVVWSWDKNGDVPCFFDVSWSSSALSEDSNPDGWRCGVPTLLSSEDCTA